MTELAFAKYHGTGNDFVMLEDVEGERPLDAELVAALCHRRFGVGADGVIRVTGPAGAARAGVATHTGDGRAAEFFMDYRNADGSEAEMCGNGIRCLGSLVFERGLTGARDLAVATRAGVKRLWLDVDGGRVRAVTVDMGRPAFTRGDIPMAGRADDVFQAEPVEVAGRTWKGSAVSMGNPHLALFVDREPGEIDVATLGPALERDDRFPDRTNVEFVLPVDGGVRARVWERGVGETMACGTGACAALVAAAQAGLVDRAGFVQFPGGRLWIDWNARDRVMLTGPAVRVFQGSVDPGAMLAAWREAGA